MTPAASGSPQQSKPSSTADQTPRPVVTAVTSPREFVTARLTGTASVPACQRRVGCASPSNSGDVVVIGEPRDGIDVDGAAHGGGRRGDRREGRLRRLHRPGAVGHRRGRGQQLGRRRPSKARSGRSASRRPAPSFDAEDVGSIDARTVSGRLRVEAGRGAVRLTTKSARVHVGRVDGEVRCRQPLGPHRDRAAQAAVSAKTVSGTISMRVDGREPVKVETVSGKIRISVPERVRPSVRHRTRQRQAPRRARGRDDLEISARRSACPATSRSASRERRDRPATVEGAIAFTDLVGFTEFTATPRRPGGARGARRAGARSCATRCPDGARVVKELGDGLLLFFPDSDAPRSPAASRSSTGSSRAADADEMPLWVRAGLHWGRPSLARRRPHRPRRQRGGPHRRRRRAR